MDEASMTHSRAWSCFKIAILIAAGMAAWAAFGADDCGSCVGAARMLGGKPLAAAGVLYYAVLFIAAEAFGPSLVAYSGALFAAGIHGGLLVILARERIFCAPCIGTALAAFFALVCAIRCDRSNAFRASLIIPAAAFLIQMGAILLGAPPPAQAHAQAQQVLAEEQQGSPAVPQGRVQLLVYSRPDCGYCIELERDVLPGITQEFGERLEILRRSAAELPGIPTPTLILIGAEQRRLISGLPEPAELRKAILGVMGGGHAP